VKLLYFSWIRERLDMPEEEVLLPGSVQTVGDLLAWQKTRGDEYEAVFQHDKIVRVALDQEHVDERSTPLAGVNEIAFFPPMTGG